MPELVRAEQAVRRAPFSDNPVVGARGQRTQRRILEAALSVFAAVGYHQCSIESITQVAGCSRATFYQYFSGKDDVFRHLAARVARQLDAATDWLEPITPDPEGWNALRGWIGRYAEIYDRHEAVFRAFPVVAEADAAIAEELVRAGQRYAAQIRNRVEGCSLAPRDLHPIIDLFLRCFVRTLDDAAMLGAAAPDAFPRGALLDSLADVTHRTLFGLSPGVNVHHTSLPPPPRLLFGRGMRAELQPDPPSANRRDGPTRDGLLAAGKRVLLSRGYHGASVDAVVEAAGVSRGTFYHYFDNKEQLVRHLAVTAMRGIAVTLRSIPDNVDEDGASSSTLRRWLRDYNRAQAEESAMIRVWVDAALQDEELMSESAPVLDWGRRRMAHFLRNRGFGDIEIDAVVLLALLDGLGVAERPPSVLDAAVRIIERGFLGR